MPDASPMSGPMTAAAVRRFADANTARIAAVAPDTRQIVAQIVTVNAGQAKDGNAVVLVLWRGTVCTVNGYNRAYTPVVGHQVVCDYINGQLYIAYSPIGQP